MAGKIQPREAQLDAFIKNLAGTQHVGRSCVAAGLSHTTLYRQRARDPDFAARWAAALEVLPARVMDAAIEEGLEGAPIFDDEGNVIGRKRDTQILRDLMRKFLAVPGDGANINIDLGSRDQVEAEIRRRIAARTTIDGETQEVEDNDAD